MGSGRLVLPFSWGSPLLAASLVLVSEPDERASALLPFVERSNSGHGQESALDEQRLCCRAILYLLELPRSPFVLPGRQGVSHPRLRPCSHIGRLPSLIKVLLVAQR